MKRRSAAGLGVVGATEATAAGGRLAHLADYGGARLGKNAGDHAVGDRAGESDAEITRGAGRADRSRRPRRAGRGRERHIERRAGGFYAEVRAEHAALDLPQREHRRGCSAPTSRTACAVRSITGRSATNWRRGIMSEAFDMLLLGLRLGSEKSARWRLRRRRARWR